MKFSDRNGALRLIFFFLVLIFCAPVYAQKESQTCLACHKETTPQIINHWKDSRHAKVGVSCFECHRAKKGEPDAFEHNGFTIATIVSPKDCGQCHAKEFKEQQGSRHADAASFIGSLDNTLGEIVEGGPAAVSGCRQCHGSTVKVLKDGKIDPATWPNGGMGRVNPDGSKGSCAACHYRHEFSLKVARAPDTCGRCHMGPDHPQREIYGESKHGINFMANIDKMNLGKKKWVLGKDYSAAPNCVTCHMGATANLKSTHDVGARISWTLRPPVSVKVADADKKRVEMQSVCQQCHSPQWVDNFYTQYDNVVNHYNDKFGKPAKEIMDKLLKAGKITKTPFDEEIEWTYYELWHHEGRRARMGAAMMGPDFTQWHGFYEVAKHFYAKFIPEAEKLLPGVSRDIMNSDFHKWKKGFSKEEIEKQIEFYKGRYQQ
ncbi:cytochrome c3 family protein [Candidatus Saganbacteria bacterium]|nr:cytochrome c3 family protein [Candidatus Saganbacteria bacterium]